MDADTLQLLEDCEHREERLNSWEHDFLVSVRAQVEAGRSLSKKQLEQLDELWERATARG